MVSQTPIAEAGSLLVRAYDATNDMQAETGSSPRGQELFDLMMFAMRVLSIWIALGDGVLSPEESLAINDILWLDKQPCDNVLVRDTVLNDATVRESVQFLGQFVAIASYVAAQKGLPSDKQSTLLYRAVETVFEAVLAADTRAQPEVERLVDIMQRIRDVSLPPTNSAASANPDQTSPATEAVPKAGSIEADLAELDALIGLDAIKTQVRSLVNLARIFKMRREMGLQIPAVSFHLVFLGKPGTGKTTVARLISRLYVGLGLLPKVGLVEVDRSGLVANYVGQTATKVQGVLAKALGGVLFIDEAYMLDSGGPGDYGEEAVATLLKGMEDHRSDLVVIAAGYPAEMQRFLDMNPGLRSRMSRELTFEDYSPTEMVAIFEGMAVQAGYTIATDAHVALGTIFQRSWDTRSAHFANARDVRNVFERAIGAQADRLCALADQSGVDVQLLTADDIVLAGAGALSNRRDAAEPSAGGEALSDHAASNAT